MRPAAGVMLATVLLHATAVAGETRSLFERVGGKDVLVDIADDYVDAIIFDPVLHENPHIAKASAAAPVEYMKVQIAMMFCERSGGPCKHRSRPMGEAFEPMKFREQDWQRARALFEGVLSQHGIAPAEKDGLLAIFGGMKRHFLGPGGKPAGAD